MGCGGFGSVGSVAAVAVGSIEGGEMIGVAAAPLDEEDGRVVAGDAASFLFQGVGERAHHRPHRRVVTDGSVGPLDELLLTELFTTGLMLFNQAIGETQQPVPGLQHPLADYRLLTAEADRQCGRALQPIHHGAATDQQRCRVAGIDPLQLLPVAMFRHIIWAVTKWSGPNCSLMALSMNAYTWDRPVLARRAWR